MDGRDTLIPEIEVSLVLNEKKENPGVLSTELIMSLIDGWRENATFRLVQFSMEFRQRKYMLLVPWIELQGLNLVQFTSFTHC